MNFLNPTAIAIAAGLTIPPLVALYFLKLKRQVWAVPSTLLWKRAVEDLRANAPFQRLRSSLLLLLQLLVLIAGALALGKPMRQAVETSEDAIIFLMDQSASMGVIEADGRSRLEWAKQQAKRSVDNMADDARAMVIAFCDQATVVGSFDTNKEAIKRKIDSIEQTHSTSALSEAIRLAEAHTQNLIIGSDEAGSDVAPEMPVTPATVIVFTDGRIEDADQVALQEFDVTNITVRSMGTRSDNVGIVNMDARRNYERPEMLEVTATVENFGPQPIDLDIVLYIEGRNVDIKSIHLEPSRNREAGGAGPIDEPTFAHSSVVAFDDMEFADGGLIEVRLRVDDALGADNRAWAIVDAPRHVRVLLVTEGNLFLENVLSVLPIDVVTMTPEEYEGADQEQIMEGRRSAFHVVLVDRHSTARLPPGNYFFWAGAPLIDGVSLGELISDEVIFNWDETHPLLRHVAAETIFIYEWVRLQLPREAETIIEGESSAVLAYLTRGANRYLMSAFSLITNDDAGRPTMNTYWCTSVDFVVFMQNAIQYLASNTATAGRTGVRPGEPVTWPMVLPGETATVVRPDQMRDRIPLSDARIIHYARTRQVGVYHVEPAPRGEDIFTVNLFNEVESRVEPAPVLTLGTQVLKAQVGAVEVHQPAWHYFLLAVLVLLLLEWILYNKRVFV